MDTRWRATHPYPQLLSLSALQAHALAQAAIAAQLADGALLLDAERRSYVRQRLLIAQTPGHAECLRRATDEAACLVALSVPGFLDHGNLNGFVAVIAGGIAVEVNHCRPHFLCLAMLALITSTDSVAEVRHSRLGQ